MRHIVLRVHARLVARTLVSLLVVVLLLMWLASHWFGGVAFMPVADGAGRLSLSEGTLEIEYVTDQPSESSRVCRT